MNGTHLNTMVDARGTEETLEQIMRAVPRTERPVTQTANDLLFVALRYLASAAIAYPSVDSVLTEARFRARVVPDPEVRRDLDRLAQALESVTPYEV